MASGNAEKSVWTAYGENGVNGVLAANVAVRRSKGGRSVLFILEAAEAGSIFFCTLTITSSSC